MKKLILSLLVVGVLVPMFQVEARHCGLAGLPTCEDWVKTIVNKSAPVEVDEKVVLEAKIVELKQQLGILQMKWRKQLRDAYNASLRTF